MKRLGVIAGQGTGWAVSVTAPAAASVAMHADVRGPHDLNGTLQRTDAEWTAVARTRAWSTYPLVSGLRLVQKDGGL